MKMGLYKAMRTPMGFLRGEANLKVKLWFLVFQLVSCLETHLVRVYELEMARTRERVIQ